MDSENLKFKNQPTGIRGQHATYIEEGGFPWLADVQNKQNMEVPC